MGAFKQFLASDIIVTPLEVNKNFTFQGDSVFTGSNVGIDRFLGRNFNNTSSTFEGGIYGSSIYNDPFSTYVGSDPSTGEIEPVDFESLIYYSIRHLYYSNYLSSSYGDSAPTASIILGSQPNGNVLTGSLEGPRYDNYLQTTLTYPQYFPTTSIYQPGETAVGVGVISIPTKLYGDYIRPGSFYFSAESGSLTDDGEGNILLNGDIVGNIIYPHGLITITSASSDIIQNFVTSPNVTCSFSSSYTIQETQYKVIDGHFGHDGHTIMAEKFYQDLIKKL